MSRWLVIAMLEACGYTPSSVSGGGDAPTDVNLGNDGPPAFVRRINLGGPTVTGSDFPGTWEADSQAASVCPSADFWVVTGDIKNTVDDDLFLVHAYSLPTLTCAIPNIPTGDYTVRLLYGPTFYGTNCNGTGFTTQRFSIVLEGTVAIGDYVVTAESEGCVAAQGTNPAAHPVTRSFDVTISDGTLNLVETAPSGDAAMLSAIEIVAR